MIIHILHMAVSFWHLLLHPLWIIITFVSKQEEETLKLQTPWSGFFAADCQSWSWEAGSEDRHQSGSSIHPSQWIVYCPFLNLNPASQENVLPPCVASHSITHLHSLDIPTAKHFCSRQYWQRFLVILLMMQFLSRWHVYTMFFCTLRRKKPCTGNRRPQVLQSKIVSLYRIYIEDV